MPIIEEIRWQVQQRAGFACEYCGVSEIDVGSELTIDHYRPLSKGGDDSLENLIYCCMRCNQHKSDYWAKHSTSIEFKSLTIGRSSSLCHPDYSELQMTATGLAHCGAGSQPSHYPHFGTMPRPCAVESHDGC